MTQGEKLREKGAFGEEEETGKRRADTERAREKDSGVRDGVTDRQTNNHRIKRGWIAIVAP